MYAGFDTVIEVLMALLLLLLPAAMGGIYVWTEQIALSLAGAMLFLGGLKSLLRKRQKLFWTAALLPVVLILLWVGGQLLPLPIGLVAFLSPRTAALKAELLAELVRADNAFPSVSLSFYPQATWETLRLMLLASGVFVVTLNYFRREERIKRLLFIITGIGIAIAGLALLQRLPGNGKIYWIIPTWHHTATSGPFVNHSHYCQYMNLCIGAAWGLMLTLYYERKTRKQPAFSREILKKHFRQDYRVWLPATAIVLGTVTVFLSLSRGGTISLLVAGTAMVLIMAHKRRFRWQVWIMLLLALAAGATALYVGFENVYDRWAALQQGDRLHGRWQLIEGARAISRDFPLSGIGLGAHEMIYALYHTSPATPAIAVFVENEYMQMLAECGWPGLIVVISFITIIWYYFYRCVKRISVPVRAAAIGLGFGLLAVQIHSLSDYGQHLPANACLSAIYSALLINIFFLGHRHRGHKTVSGFSSVPVAGVSKNRAANLRRRFMDWGSRSISHYYCNWHTKLFSLRLVALSRAYRIILLCIIMVGWGWMLIEVNAARRAEASWRRALTLEEQLRHQNWQGSEADYQALLSHAANAVRLQPYDVKKQYWLCAYEWEYLRSKEAVFESDAAREKAKDIVARLHRQRRECPTFGPVYCLAGQLEHYLLEQPRGRAHIRQAYRLASNRPSICYAAGLLDAEQQRLAASLEKFKRYLHLGGSFDRMTDVYLNQLDRPEMAFSLVLNDPVQLVRLAKTLRASASHQALEPTVLNIAIAQLEKQIRQARVNTQTLALLAQACYLNEQYTKAEEYLRQALDRDYGRLGWRFTLADILARTGRYALAVEELQTCLRLKPGWDKAHRLMQQYTNKLEQPIQ